MDTQDIRTLKILQEFDADDLPSQRYLSKKLGISLGLVNSFLKRLAQKGYFKATTIPKNRVKYILTPKGALEKSRLTYEYIHYSFKFYRDARIKLHKIFNQLDQLGVRHIIFYGVSDLAEIAYISLQETPIQLLAIVDGKKQSELFFKHKVESPDIISNLSEKKVFITTADADNNHYNALLGLGVRQENIITFHQGE